MSCGQFGAVLKTNRTTLRAITTHSACTDLKPASVSVTFLFTLLVVDEKSRDERALSMTVICCLVFVATATAMSPAASVPASMTGVKADVTNVTLSGQGLRKRSPRPLPSNVVTCHVFHTAPASLKCKLKHRPRSASGRNRRESEIHDGKGPGLCRELRKRSLDTNNNNE